MTGDWTREEFTISTDPARIDVTLVHGFLARAYWSRDVPREVVERAIAGSLVFGVYGPTGQVGFARVVTDGATFAWLADVFILEPFRGRRLAAWLVETVLAHPKLQGLRRWILATQDAHDLYRRFGFVEAPAGRLMEIVDLDVYRRR
jgi:GNAT superfamily N-acetyltransferase